MGQRLREAASGRAVGGAELVLAGREKDLEDFYREQSPGAYTRCPACGKLSADPYDCDRCGAHIEDAPPAAKLGRGRAPKPLPFNSMAYQKGVRVANTADFNGQRRTGAATKKALS